MEFFNKRNTLAAKNQNQGSLSKVKEALRSAPKLGMMFIVGTLLISCASDPASSQRKQISTYIKEGNNLEAFNMAFPLVTESWAGAETMRETLKENPSLKSNFPKSIRLKIDSKENGAAELIELKEKIDRAASVEALTRQERETLLDYLSKVAEDANKSGKVKFLLSDDYTKIPSLTSNEATSIIFKRSVEALKDHNAPKRLELSRKVFLYAEKKGANSAEYAQVKEALPSFHLSISELRLYAERLYPEVANKLIAERSLVISISAGLDDRQLKEDISAKLKDRSQAIVIVPSEQKYELNITLKRLQWEKISKPEKTQSVTYAQHEVYLLQALSMPKNASFLYDVSSGGVTFNYAFEVKMNDHTGKEVYSSVVREQISKDWRSCSNSRIKEVTGVIQPANFIANDKMQSVCSGALPPSNENWMRESALHAVVSSIYKAKPIEQIISSTN